MVDKPVNFSDHEDMICTWLIARHLGEEIASHQSPDETVSKNNYRHSAQLLRFDSFLFKKEENLYIGEFQCEYFILLFKIFFSSLFFPIGSLANKNLQRWLGKLLFLHPI